MRIFFTLLIIFLPALFYACGHSTAVVTEQAVKPEVSQTAPAEAAGADVNPIPPEEPDVPKLSEKDALIAEILGGMTLYDKIGQMFICSFEMSENGGGALLEIDQSTVDTVKEYGVGGVIYFASNIDTAEQTAKLSEDFQAASQIPLFIAVDEEGGRVSRITRSGKIDAEIIPPAKVIGSTGDSEMAFEAASSIADELKALGINMNLAPCADLNSDNQGVIGDRAFSDDPAIAGEFVQKSIDGFTLNGIICTIKHFPGHGVAPGDTHDQEIVSEKSLEEILEADMIPFIAGAEAGSPLIMASHITVPEWGAPASMSAEAVRYIRDVIGYDGLIITDSFRMGAVVNYYSAEEAAVKAVNAGVNIILMPVDLGAAIEGVASSVLSGETDIIKIDSSVEKILSLKYDYGLLDSFR